MNSEEKYRPNLRLADEYLERILSWQILDPDDHDCGGFRNPGTLRVEQTRAAHVFGLCTLAYLQSDSKFYREPDLVKKMRLISRYLVRIQRSDGSIDLHISNIRSAPDTAFAVRPLCRAYKVLKETGAEHFQDILKAIGKFLKKASTCLAYGEMHTPNHRWVAVAAMGCINSIFPDDIPKVASEDYLSDGIDMNEEGMYTYEKSNSIYTWVSNSALLDIARLWNKPYLIEYVRKNLDFIMYNLHPNGEVVDEYSRRQDRSTHRPLSASAFDVYRKMAARDKNGLYASMADEAFRLQIERGVAPAGYISRKDFIEFEAIPRKPLPSEYVRIFPVSKNVRIRHGKQSATIMADNFNNVFTVRNGETIIDGLKIRYNYWGWRYFNP